MALDWLLAFPAGQGEILRQELLRDTCDVADFAMTTIEARGEVPSPLPVNA
jgi:hypothetical protein